MVLAGGARPSLGPLVEERAKAAVPFAGCYRLIDFVLTNLMRSGCRHVSVLAQHRPASLMDHLGTGASWDLSGVMRTLKILPPFLGGQDSGWYRGSADAVFQNLDFIARYNPQTVLVLSADHVYSMDYRGLVARHRRRGADATLVVAKIPDPEPSRFGHVRLDRTRRLVGFDEKPAGAGGEWVSLGIYAFKTSALVPLLQRDARLERSSHQFGGDIVPALVRRGSVEGYPIRTPWRYLGTLHEFWAAHMELLGPAPQIRPAAWGVRTNPDYSGAGDRPPTILQPGCRVQDAWLAEGGHIAGAVVRSVLGPGVRVESGAEVIESVIMHDAVIGPGARVIRSVLDKNVELGAECLVGSAEPAAANRASPQLFDRGIVVIGKGVQVPPGTAIGANCVVWSHLGPDRFPAGGLPAGSTLLPGGELQ